MDYNVSITNFESFDLDAWEKVKAIRVQVDLLAGLAGKAPGKIEIVNTRINEIEINLREVSMNVDIIKVANTNF